MTWDEFKAYVDKQIAEQGADGSINIWYIDVCYPDPTTARGVDVGVERQQRIGVVDQSWIELTVS